MNSSDVLMRLAALAEQTGENVSDFRLDFMTKSLLPLGLDKVCAALERLLETSRRFPTVAEVKAEMGMSEPSIEDEARLLVERICATVGKHGEIPPGNTTLASAVKLSLGEAAWDIVGKSGGWNAVIARLGENEIATRAQIRDIAAVYLRTGMVERGTLPLNPPSASKALEIVHREERLALPEAPAMSESDKLLLTAKIADLKKERAEMLARSEKAYEQAKRELEGK